MDLQEQKIFNFRRHFPCQAYWLDGDVRTTPWKELLEFKSSMGKAAQQLWEKIEKRDNAPTDSEGDALGLADDMLRHCNEEIAYQEKNGKQPRGGIRLGGGKTQKAEEHEFRTGQVGLSMVDMYGRGDLGGYDSAEHFWQCALTRTIPAGAEQRSLMVGIGQQGGFAAPTQYIADVYSAAVSQAVFAQRCKMIRMTGMQAVWPKWRSEDRASGSTGAFMGSWVAEGATWNEVDAQMASMTFTAKKLIVGLAATREIIQDGVGIAPVLGNILAENLRFCLDKEIFMGDGVHGPLGILESPCKIQVARASAGAIGYNDVVAMYSRLAPYFMPSAAWFVSPSAMAYIVKLADAGNNSVWCANAAPGLPSVLFGVPVIVNEFSKGVGTEGDIVLASLQEYGLAMRQEIIIESSNSVHWSTDKIAFRATLRGDGQSLMDRVITPLSGPTLSSIVTLS